MPWGRWAGSSAGDSGSDRDASDGGRWSDGESAQRSHATEATLRSWWTTSTAPSFLSSKASRRDLWILVLPSLAVLALVDDVLRRLSHYPSDVVISTDVFFMLACACAGLLPRQASVGGDHIVACLYFCHVMIRRMLLPARSCFGTWELLGVLAMAAGGVHSSALAVFLAASALVAPLVGVCWEPEPLIACMYVLFLSAILEVRVGPLAASGAWTYRAGRPLPQRPHATGFAANHPNTSGYVGIPLAVVSRWSVDTDDPPPGDAASVSSPRMPSTSRYESLEDTAMQGGAFSVRAQPPCVESTSPPVLVGAKTARAAKAAVDSVARSIAQLFPSCSGSAKACSIPGVPDHASGGESTDDGFGSEDLELASRGDGLRHPRGDAESSYAGHGPPKALVLRAAPRRKRVESSPVRIPYGAALAVPDEQAAFEFEFVPNEAVGEGTDAPVVAEASTADAEANNEFDRQLFEVGDSAPEPEVPGPSVRTLPKARPTEATGGRLGVDPPTTSSAASAGSLAKAPGYVRCVKLAGFTRSALNTMFMERNDPALAIGGRPTYWTPHEDYFLHYSVRFRAWVAVSAKRYEQVRNGEWCAVALAPRGLELKDRNSNSGASTPTSATSWSKPKCWKEWDRKTNTWVARDSAGVLAVGRARRVGSPTEAASANAIGSSETTAAGGPSQHTSWAPANFRDAAALPSVKEDESLPADIADSGGNGA